MASLNDGSGPFRPNPGISPMTGSAHGGRGSGSDGSPPAPPVTPTPAPPPRPTTPTTPAEDDPTMGSTPPTSTTNPAEDTSRPNLHADLPAIISEEPPAPTEALGRILIPAGAVDWSMVAGLT